MAYSNPYYSDSYDEYKARQLKQKTGQNFLDESGYQTPQVNIQQQRPTNDSSSSNIMGGIGSKGIGGIAGAAAGVTAALSPPPGEHGFSMDPMAGYTGSLSGLSSGGAIGAVLGGIAGEAGSFIKAGRAIDRYNVGNDLGAQQFDINGKPIYNSQGVFAAQRAANELSDAEKSSKSWLEGGKAGGLLGIDSTTLFGKINGYQRKARNKRNQVIAGIQKFQNDFNTQDQQFQNQTNQTEEYNKRLNNQSRINNLYSIPRTYQQMF